MRSFVVDGNLGNVRADLIADRGINGFECEVGGVLNQRSLAASHRFQRFAHLEPGEWADPSQFVGEHRFRYSCEVVERGDTSTVYAVVGPYWNAGGNFADRCGDWSHHNVVEHRDRFVSGHHESWTAFGVRCFHEPQLALGYHGSASVMAIALVIAWASSSAV